MRRRGSELILTYVPTPRPLGGSPRQLADLLEVPLAWPEPAFLQTADDDHLDEPSAVAWTEAFVRELGRLLP
jgi:hypothetical protein